MITILRINIYAVGTIIAKIHGVISIAAVAEAGMRPDLSIRFLSTKFVLSEVEDITLAQLVVSQGQLPTLQVSSLQWLRTIIARNRPRKEIHLTVVIVQEVEVKLLLPLAAKLREISLITSVVAIQSIKSHFSYNNLKFDLNTYLFSHSFS